MKATKIFLLGVLGLSQVAWTNVNAAQKNRVSVDETKPLKIVFDNDVHGSIDRYEYLAGYRDALKEAGYPVLTVSVGDYMQGSAYASVSRGQYCVDMMNAVGYDVMAIGNHDVDYGVPHLMALRDSLNKTAMVCANLYNIDNKRCLPAYTMANVGGYRVAFVGVVTTATEQLQANVVFDREGNRQCSFAKDSLVMLVQRAIDEVRLGRPDWVILLTHMGEEPLNSHMASWQLMEKLHGVDVMLDAHSHSVINTVIYPQGQENSVPVAQTGYGMKNVGCLTLEKGAVPYVKLYAYQNLPQSADVHQKYKKVVDDMQPIMGQVVGYTPFDLLQSFAGKRLVRNQETNLGDLVADAYRVELGTDIGWVNGGGIRHGIEMGDITYGQMLSVSPFNNFMCIAQAKGQMIADAMEECYHNCPTDLGSFAQISGLRCVIDTTVSNGLSRDKEGRLIVDGRRRVSNIEVYKDGQWRPMNMNELLTIGSTNYVLFEGELQGLKNAKLIKDKVMTDTECLQTYITKTLGGIIPDPYSKPQGRIIIK